MWTTRVRSVLTVLLLGVATALGTAGSARAALYTGNYDPPYGGIFPQLGWEASVLVDVPNACRAIGNGTNIPISGPCGNFGFSLILFAGNQAQLIFANPAQTSPGCAFLPVPDAHCGISENAATGVFALVPEPETLALMLAGLGTIGLVARRRRR